MKLPYDCQVTVTDLLGAIRDLDVRDITCQIDAGIEDYQVFIGLANHEPKIRDGSLGILVSYEEWATKIVPARAKWEQYNLAFLKLAR